MVVQGIKDAEDARPVRQILDDVRAGREATSSLGEVEARLGLTDRVSVKSKKR